MENAAADVSPWTLTVDIGGSKVNAALVDKDGRIGPRKTYGGPMADYAVALGAVSPGWPRACRATRCPRPRPGCPSRAWSAPTGPS